MALTSAQRVELIQKMYVAYYGRPADTGGLDNWVNHLVKNNDDATAIIQAFGTSPEATSLYGEPVNYAEAVNALYMQMFNRAAEPDGLALYVSHLNAGRVTLPNLALAIATGAQNSDLDTFTNKVEVATAFTAEVATSTENILGYAGEDAAAHAAAFLASVDATDASVTDALADLESTIEMINGLDQLSSLPTHYLTSALDNLLGTNGNDVVLAELDGNQDLELDDAFNALLGQDTLRLDIVDTNSNVDFIATDYEMVGFERVLVQARADDADLYLDLDGMVGVDLEVRNMIGGEAELAATNIDGDVLITNYDGYDLNINNVSGDISISDITVNDVNMLSDGDLTLDGVDGSVTASNMSIDEDLRIDALGNVSVSNTTVDDDFDILNSNNVILTSVFVGDDLGIGDANENSDVNGITGNVTFDDVTVEDNINIVFAESVTSATINISDLTHSDFNYNNNAPYFDIQGAELANVVINVNEASNIGELHLHNNPSLTSVTLNINDDLVIDELQGVTDENIDLAATLTINGAADLEINSIVDDDLYSIVYTGSGSLQIGDERRDFNDNNNNYSSSDWEPEVGSFNAATATGDVTIYLDLDSADDLDFTYVGSRGSDRVVIDEDSLGAGASDVDTVRLSIAGGSGVDTLVVSDDSDLTAEAMAAISGFEVLEITEWESEEFDLAETHNDFTSVTLALTSDANGNHNDENVVLANLSVAQAANITIDTAGDHDDHNMFDDLTIDLEDTTGSSDLVGITIIASNTTDINQVIDESLVLNDIEHLEITTSGDAYYLDGNGDLNLNDPIDALWIDNIDTNDLETLTIDGSVGLIIADMNNSDDLREIDARSFTGAFLGLGFEGTVWTDDDLIIQGSLTADHYIDVNGNEDVTVTTGSGDDVMYIDGLDNVVINAGDGNNNINVWSLDDDITVTTGSGDDTIDVSGGDEGETSDYAEDVTVSMGAGDDDFDYNSDEIDGDLEVDAGAGDDTVRVYLDSNSNINTVTVTLGTGADDLWLDDTSWDSNNDVVVTVTDFAVADDVVYLDESAAFEEGAEYVTVETQDGEYDVTETITNEQVGVIEFSFDADNNGVTLDINSTGADLLEALGDDGDQAIITVNEDQVGYIVAYNGGNAYIFNYEDTSGSNPSATVNDYDSGTDAEGIEDTENFDVTLASGTEGFNEGDYITFNNILDLDNDFVYTIQAGETGVDTLGANIAAAINALANTQYDVSYDTVSDQLYFISEAFGNFTDATVVYTNLADTEIVEFDEIELIGVFENIAVGGFTALNIGFDPIA